MPTFVDVPEIKLIRTDTTLDLSQKAEKVCLDVPPAVVEVLWRANKTVVGVTTLCEKITCTQKKKTFFLNFFFALGGPLRTWWRSFIDVEEAPSRAPASPKRGQAWTRYSVKGTAVAKPGDQDRWQEPRLEKTRHGVETYKFFQNWLRVPEPRSVGVLALSGRNKNVVGVSTARGRQPSNLIWTEWTELIKRAIRS